MNARIGRNEGQHCENCGSQAWEDLNQGDQGYTACCNEPVCYGDHTRIWQTENVGVQRACCDAKLRETFPNVGASWR